MEVLPFGKLIWVCLKMVSTPLYPMVLLIIIPMKWLFHWEYIPYFQTNPYGIFVGGLHSKISLRSLTGWCFGT